jgi:thiol:disulfide interchange protein DsbD
MRFLRTRTLLLAALAARGAAAASTITSASEPAHIPHGTVELVSEYATVHPGSTFTVGLLFRLEPGWHIYWKNPGDSGLPPHLRWNLPDGVAAGQIQWPTPRRLPVGNLLDYGYEGDVLLPLELEASNAIADMPSVTLAANLRALVCRETCMPGKADLSLKLPVSSRKVSAATQYQPLFAAARAHMPVAPPAVLQASAEQSGANIVLTISGVKGSAANFLPDKNGEISNAAPQNVQADPQGLKLTLVRARDSQAVASRLQGVLVLRNGAGSTAYNISANVSAAPPSAAAGTSDSIPVALVLAFLGGIVLNLMPCVFPVLSIKALHLVESTGKHDRPVRLGALAYTAGVLVSFWILVAILLVLRAGGTRLGWGFQLQSPGFVAFLCCLLFVFGLSLAGVFEIGGSLMSFGSGLAERSGLAGSFFTGVLATVVATPCTAPFMGAAIGFALSQAAWICALVFTAMAIGLASPFLLLAFAPQLGRWIPRPGRWMETLKQLLAFPIFATVIWLLWVLGQQVAIDQLAIVLFCLLAIAVGAWVVGRWPSQRISAIAAALLIVAASAYSITALPSSGSAEHGRSALVSGLQWEPFSAERVKQFRSEGKPVLVDFTAAWCVTCQVNDRVVFHSQQVQDQLRADHVALLRADWTSYDPHITEALAQFGRSAVPLYVLYRPGEEQPYVFPDGLLRPSAVVRELEKLKTSAATRVPSSELPANSATARPQIPA